MRELYGRRLLESDGEVLEPRHTALLVVDMQNDFGHPQGHFARSGSDVGPVTAIVPAVAGLVSAAREGGLLVVWVQQSTLPDGRSDSPAWLSFKSRHGEGFDTAYTLEGGWGQSLLEPLTSAPGEPVVKKHRSSAFTRTSMDTLLRANGVQTTVVCGCMTEGCVESTARDCGFHDYYVVVAEDAVASNTPALHDAAMTVMRSQFRVRSCRSLAQTWQPAEVGS